MCPLYPILRGTYFPPSPPPSENENILSPQNRTQTKSSPFLYVLLETFKKSRKKFSQSIARAATSQPFSFALTPNPPEKKRRGKEGVVVTKCPSVYFNQNLQKQKEKFQGRSYRITAVELSTRKKWSNGSEGKSSSCAHTWRGQWTEQRKCGASPRKRGRLNGKDSPLFYGTHTHTNQNHTKQKQDAEREGIYIVTTTTN